jgi:hypothetical protein
MEQVAPEAAHVKKAQAAMRLMRRAESRVHMRVILLND